MCIDKCGALKGPWIGKFVFVNKIWKEKETTSTCGSDEDEAEKERDKHRSSSEV